MRALLVVNPKATATTARTRDVLARALGSEAKVDIVETTHRGHAIELSAQARADGIDLVVALGGDGTVNEVVNGLLAAGEGDDVPQMAVVPAGNANVFARTLGMPDEPVEATAAILEALRAGSSRRIGLGSVQSVPTPVRGDGDSVGPLPALLRRRWFTFCAGIGLDAEAVARVEKRRSKGRRATPGLYVRSALAQFFLHTDRRRPAVTLTVDGAEPVDDVFLMIVSNTAPWTYLGTRPINPSPRASFETGLDLVAVRSLRTAGSLRLARQLLLGGRGLHGRSVADSHDVGRIVVDGARPVALQVDGDYLGEHRHVAFDSHPSVLQVVVPSSPGVPTDVETRW